MEFVRFHDFRSRLKYNFIEFSEDVDAVDHDFPRLDSLDKGIPMRETRALGQVGPLRLKLQDASSNYRKPPLWRLMPRRSISRVRSVRTCEYDSLCTTFIARLDYNSSSPGRRVLIIHLERARDGSSRLHETKNSRAKDRGNRDRMIGHDRTILARQTTPTLMHARCVSRYSYRVIRTFFSKLRVKR